jgi:multimeric flavodoxin WrbA
MKILGISGSPRQEKRSNTYRLVQKVLKSTGLDYELISLRAKRINGCIACLGCVHDNTCVVNDDMTPLRQKIINADAYVIGAPNYYTTINSTTASMLERWYQFRHRTADMLWGKLAVTVGVGGSLGNPPADDIEKYMSYNFIETVAKVTAQGAASCFDCGYGEKCKVGLPVMLYGENVKIKEEMVPDISKQPKTIKAAELAGKLLAQRLKKHNRKEVAEKMQKIMAEKFAQAT